MRALFDDYMTLYDDEEALREFTDAVLGVGAYDKGFGVYRIQGSSSVQRVRPHVGRTCWLWMVLS